MNLALVLSFCLADWQTVAERVVRASKLGPGGVETQIRNGTKDDDDDDDDTSSPKDTNMPVKEDTPLLV